MITVKAALSFAQQQFSAVGLDSPRLDAEYLLSYCWPHPRSYWYAHPDAIIPDTYYQTFLTLVQQRQSGFPVAYLTGRCEFWSLPPLQVSPATLIPRSETELLVAQALLLLQSGDCVLDMGTGSGAIALALAHECPTCEIMALDCSATALAVAERNVQQLAPGRIKLLQSDWFQALSSAMRFSMIIANPPYIAEDDPHLHAAGIRFEPRLALTSGRDGLTALRHLIQHAPDFLRQNGYLLLEHGYNQAPAVQTLLKARGYRAIHSFQDLAGWPRVTQGQWYE